MSIYRILLLSVNWCLLTACSMSDYQHSVEIASLQNSHQALARLSYQKNNYRALTPQEYDKDNTALTTLQNDFYHHVINQWGEDQALFSTNHRYIKYTNNYRSRSIIDFQQGFVRVETLEQQQGKHYLKQAIEYVLLAPEQPQYTDFYTSYTSEVKGRPFLHQQVSDADGNAIKWHWRAARYANYLLETQYQDNIADNNPISSVTFSLNPAHTKVRMLRYQPQINRYAKHYDINVRVINAMIAVDSLFNPYALNNTGRIGLMQISDSIGADVFKQQKKYPFKPQPNWLFNNNNNLDIGISYLNLLDTHYLQAIKNPTSRYYAMLASYIADPKIMLQTFSKNKTDAFSIINTLSPYEIYQSFTNKHAHPEIKNYVYTVNSYLRRRGQ